MQKVGRPVVADYKSDRAILPWANISVFTFDTKTTEESKDKSTQGCYDRVAQGSSALFVCLKQKTQGRMTKSENQERRDADYSHAFSLWR